MDPMIEPIIKSDSNILIYIFPDPLSLFQSTALDFSHRAIEEVKVKNEFNVVLSGGSTPKKFYDELTTIPFCRENTPWDKIKFFFADERYVPLDDPESNYLMAYEHLFSKVPILKTNIFPIETHFHDPTDAARNYQKSLRKVFNLKTNELPCFDAVYLGLGEDGHTASLMPESEAVKTYSRKNHSERKDPNDLTFITNQKSELVAALWVPKLSMHRITLTPAAINNAQNVIFLVSGKSKEAAVQNVLYGAYDPNQTPAQLIHCIHNRNTWFLDKDSASKIEKLDNC